LWVKTWRRNGLSGNTILDQGQFSASRRKAVTDWKEFCCFRGSETRKKKLTGWIKSYFWEMTAILYTGRIGIKARHCAEDGWSRPSDRARSLDVCAAAKKHGTSATIQITRTTYGFGYEYLDGMKQKVIDAKKANQCDVCDEFEGADGGLWRERRRYRGFIAN